MVPLLRPLAFALALASLSACARDKYPWPDFRVDEAAWRPIPPPAPPVQASVAAPASFFGVVAR